jgi:hypothetical protein
MHKSPGRSARVISLLMALLFAAASVTALVIGATQDGEFADFCIRTASSMAMLAIAWPLIGIMFTMAGPRTVERDDERLAPADRPEHVPPPKRVNWFQDATSGRR